MTNKNSNKVKTIYIYVTKFLLDHVILDVSDMSRDKFEIYIKKKYNINEVDFVYSADFVNRFNLFGDDDLLPADSLNDLNDISLKELLKKSSSKFGKDIFKIEVKNLVDLVSARYSENYCVNTDYQKIVDANKKQEKKWEDDYQNAVEIESEYLSKYQSQYDHINKTWSDFWDKKIEIFRNTMSENAFPEQNHSIFFAERNRRKYDDEVDLYLDKLRKMTDQWWEESKLLQSHLNCTCRNCGNDSSLFLNLLGPGNTHTYGRNNSNTYTSREYLLKPEYGHKLLPGKKYYWRRIYSLGGQCLKCGNQILSDRIGEVLSITNLATLKNSSVCSIYPHDDKESLYEWCGVWMTIFGWFCYELGYGERVSGRYSFFKNLS
jgi:hypothetical protein